MANYEDDRLGQLLRAIRREAGLRQEDVARAARTPRRDVIAVEAGRAGEIRLDRIRRLFVAAGGQARIVAGWRGAEADRLLDRVHAALVERVVVVLLARAWEVRTEVSFARYGERGAVDVLGLRRDHNVGLVVEVKSAIGSLEETNRRLDAKARLAPHILRDAFGLAPATVGRVLVVPDTMTIRRIVDRHAATMSGAYPARSREVRAWLRQPTAAIRGLWFVSEVRDASSRRGREAQ